MECSTTYQIRELLKPSNNWRVEDVGYSKCPRYIIDIYNSEHCKLPFKLTDWVFLTIPISMLMLLALFMLGTLLNSSIILLLMLPVLITPITLVFLYHYQWKLVGQYVSGEVVSFDRRYDSSIESIASDIGADFVKA